MNRHSLVLAAFALSLLVLPARSSLCDDGKNQASVPKIPPPATSQSGDDSYAKALPPCEDPKAFTTDFATVFPGVKAIKVAGPREVLFLFDTNPADKDSRPVDVSKARAEIDRVLGKLENACSAIGKTYYVYPGEGVDLAGKANPTTTTLGQWKTAIPGVTDIIQVPDGRFIFVIDKAPDAGSPARSRDIEAVKRQIRSVVDVEYGNLTVPFVISLPPGITNATTIATMLTGKIRNATVTASDNVRLIVTPAASDTTGQRRDALRKEIQELVDELAGPANGYSTPVISQLSRLFYYRDNKTAADALNQVLPDVTAAAVDADGIMLSASLPSESGNGGGKERTLEALKNGRRIIAQMDQPHAQVSLYAWSLQLSDKEPTDPKARSKRVDEDTRLQLVNSIAAQFNGTVSGSIGAGWNYLRDRIESSKDGDFDPVFAGYLRGRVRVNTSGEGPPTAVTFCCTDGDRVFATGLNYGLGFGQLFSDLSPNLMNMLLVVSATRNPWMTANCLIDRMEGLDEVTPCAEAPTSPPDNGTWSNPCQASDQGGYIANSQHFQMECTRLLLKRLYSGQRNPELGRFRSTVADFLFQYKLMIEYPQEFDPYLEPYSASKLDAVLVDYVDAFENDLAVLNYILRDRIAHVLKDTSKKGQSYDYSGIVAIKVVAGKQALVESKAQNYFPATPPNTLADFAKALSNAEASQPKILTGNLSGDAVTFALGALAQVTPPKQTVSIGRELDMTVTPYTLSAANGAELDVEITAKDNGASVVAANSTGGGTPPDDLSSRIAEHHVLSHVRLQSLKLFEVSSMDSALARSKEPWKPFDPYLEIPVVGDLIRRPRHPDLIRQRGVVFISAVVVPTAADLAATPIEEDYFAGARSGNIHLLPSGSAALIDRVRSYHASVLRCLTATTTGSDGTASGCTQQTLSRLFDQQTE